MTREKVLTSLRNLSAEKPTTKMGQIRWAWPEIQAALAAGHTLQLIHERLNESGIAIGYRTLSLYIGRLERRPGRRQTLEISAAPQAGKTGSHGMSQESPDPFANIRREREKKRQEGFSYHPFSIGKNLLE